MCEDGSQRVLLCHSRAMDLAAREKAVYLAKLAEQAERYDGMLCLTCVMLCAPCAGGFPSFCVRGSGKRRGEGEGRRARSRTEVVNGEWCIANGG